MTNTLVSIIMPAYNNTHTIQKTIDSCLSQTYPNLEIIVIDDGSTDHTKEALGPYIQSSKIIYFYKENGRAASARNIGLKYATGQYIQFLDADDILLPNKIAEQINFLENHPEYSGVYCDYFIEKESGLLHYKSFKPVGNLFDFFIDSTFIIPIHAPIIKNKNLPCFNESLQQNEDRAFWLDYFSVKAHNFAYIDSPLIHYCLHHTNTSYNGIENIENMSKLLRSLPQTAKVKEAIVDHHGLLGFVYLELNRSCEAKKELMIGMKTTKLKRKLFFIGLYLLSYSAPLYSLMRNLATISRSFYTRRKIK